MIEKNKSAIIDHIDNTWETSILPVLSQYIEIPNKSPLFDSQWQEHGYMDQAMDLLKTWCEQQAIKGIHIELLQLPGKTPLLFIEIDSQGSDETTLLYGHMDKQPEMQGWEDELGPWKAVRRGDKLYGRGGADDGYSVFSALTAIATLQKYQIPHGRCVVIIEASEESGSCDLPDYLNHLQSRIGDVSLVICLDSGCANYKQLWSTTSLRGVLGGCLSIDITKEGLHSGYASGVVPSTQLILRQLLNRVENVETGEVTVPALQAEVPAQRIQQAKQLAELLGERIYKAYPFVEGAKPITHDPVELLLNRTWRAQLSVIGLDGVPSVADAGNVTVPHLSVKLSFRLPPTTNVDVAANALKTVFETDPPFGADVTFTVQDKGNGWNAPPVADWLDQANQQASHCFYQQPAMYMGEGGSIPFMGALAEMYPSAQFLVTGVLGPKSNAHGPNEFLHIRMAKQLTACIASVIHAHHLQNK